MKPKRYFDNARLAIDLALELGAKGTDAGTMSNFCDTHPQWVCPGCCRNKTQIARLDNNGNFYCAIHFHHDHMYEGILAGLKLEPFHMDGTGTLHGAISSMTRFGGYNVCMDCNMAEGRAKKAIGAFKHFSFSPEEIRHFVIVENRKSHKIDVDAARRIYDSAVADVEERIEDAEKILIHVCPAELAKARANASVN